MSHTLSKCKRAYAKTLKIVMKQKTIVTILVFGVFAGSIVVLSKLGMDFMLKEDRSQMYFRVQTKPGISIYDMRKKTEARKEPLWQIYATNRYTTIQVAYGKTQNTNKSKIYVKRWKDEKHCRLINLSGQKDMAKTLYGSPTANGLVIIPAEVPLIGGGDNSALQVIIYSPSQALVMISAAKLKSMLLEGALKGSVVDYHESVFDGCWYRLHILRQNANQYGITAQDIGQAISSAFAGKIK